MNARGKTSKACDGCRLRKVKCNGQQPCQQCAHLNLYCNFSAPKDRHGRPIVRGSRLAQLKKPVRDRDRPVPLGIASRNPSAATGNSSSSSNSNISWQEDHEYSPAFFRALLDDYESVVYPVNPVIPRSEIDEAITAMDRDDDNPAAAAAAALVYAYAAVTINLAHRISSRDVNGDNNISAQIRDLMARSFAARSKADDCGGGGGGGGGGHDYYGGGSTIAASMRKIMTCVFLEVSLMALKRWDRSFIMLREAISAIQVLEVQFRKRDSSVQDHIDMAPRYQRLYWELFIHERFTTILTSYPSILPPLRSGLPGRDPTIPYHVNVGFTRLIKLFLILDTDFLNHWTSQGEADDDEDPRRRRPEMTVSWIERKQQQLDDDERSAAHDTTTSNPGADLTELQVADLFVTRVWLRTLVWQLAMSRCLLSSAPPSSAHEGLSLAFPAQRLSTQLRSLVDTLKSQTSITMHGSGILQKLFEITNTIADVMKVVGSNPPRSELLDDGSSSSSSRSSSQQRVRDLVFLVEMLLSFERIDRVQRNILKAKMEALVREFPGIGLPELDFHGTTTHGMAF